MSVSVVVGDLRVRRGNDPMRKGAHYMQWRGHLLITAQGHVRPHGCYRRHTEPVIASV